MVARVVDECVLHDQHDSHYGRHRIVIFDMGQLPVKVDWVATLVGGWVLPHTSLSLGSGPCRKYEDAVAASRLIYIAGGFEADHNGM